MVHKHRSTWKPTNGLARGRGYKYRVPRGPGGNRVTGYDPSSYWRKPEGEPSDVKKGILPEAWMSGGEQVARKDELTVTEARKTAVAAKAAMGVWVAKDFGGWRLFVTQTFRPGLEIHGPQAALHCFSKGVELIEAVMGGPVKYLVAVEAHRSGEPHVHAVVGRGRGAGVWPEDDDLRVLAARIQRDLSQKYGWSKVRLVTAGAAEYVSKYCTKQTGVWEYRGDSPTDGKFGPGVVTNEDCVFSSSRSGADVSSAVCHGEY